VTRESTSAPQAGNIPTTNIGTQAHELFVRLIPTLRAYLGENHPDLFVADYDGILARLKQRLHRFTDPEGDFEQWAKRYVASVANHRSRYYSLRRDHSREVYESIWRIVCTASDLSDEGDAAGTVMRLANETWNWAWTRVNDLLSPDAEASPGTRLFAKAHWISRAWKTGRLREKLKLASRVDSESNLDKVDRPIVCQASEPQTPANTKLLCPKCRVVRLSVSAHDAPIARLECGHERPINTRIAFKRSRRKAA
jgi:hypothetical protein